MDGTIFSHKSIWTQLTIKLGTGKEHKAAAGKYLQTDYDELVHVVIGKIWRGKPAQPFLDLINQAQYLPNVKETFKELKKQGHTLAIISSGPQQLVDRAKKELSILYGIGNTLDIKDGIITGNYQYPDGTSMWPVHDNNKDEHARILAKQTGIPLTNAIAIGDSKNDIPLFKAVKTSIAFNTQDEEVIKAATYHVKGNNLKEIIKYV